MRKIITFLFLISASFLFSQSNPVITSWLQNTTGIQGRHYVAGNYTPIDDDVDANVQLVQYSSDWVYINTTGIPAYITGPFQDGNPSLATDQDAIFRFTLNPTENTGTPTETSLGNIGNFINGVALFDWRDGVSWDPTTSSLCGGPLTNQCTGGPTATMDWNRDAVPAENIGFDCSKGHPALGNYHHHQNPTAFNLDLIEVSDVCDLYAADGLYVIDSTSHSPLIGFAYDGFPIYGAYAYKNTDGTGGITRMKSSYSLINMTTRTNGPAVDATYFLGYFKEDYEYIANSEPDYLDEHNGRFCVTPEYPNGIYCYFATVDENWNSAYPYVVGPTFYGNVTSGLVTSINETVTVYEATEDTTTSDSIGTSLLGIENDALQVNILPNPASDLVAIQIANLAVENYTVSLIDLSGKLIDQTVLYQGSTIAHFDTRTVYQGVYFVVVSNGKDKSVEKLEIIK